MWVVFSLGGREEGGGREGGKRRKERGGRREEGGREEGGGRREAGGRRYYLSMCLSMCYADFKIVILFGGDPLLSGVFRFVFRIQTRYFLRR